MSYSLFGDVAAGLPPMRSDTSRTRKAGKSRSRDYPCHRSEVRRGKSSAEWARPDPGEVRLSNASLSLLVGGGEIWPAKSLRLFSNATPYITDPTAIIAWSSERSLVYE
jgi:hypothetical protein